MASDTDVIGSFIPSLHKPSSLLPIARHRQSLLYLIETYPVIIVVGQTGSGKTTQIPQFLEQAGVSDNREYLSNGTRNLQMKGWPGWSYGWYQLLALPSQNLF